MWGKSIVQKESSSSFRFCRKILRVKNFVLKKKRNRNYKPTLSFEKKINHASKKFTISSSSSFYFLVEALRARSVAHLLLELWRGKTILIVLRHFLQPTLSVLG